MRKFTLAVLTVLFSTGLFSQQTITMNKQSYNGAYYYQGEYQLTSYKDDPENGFLPEVGMVTKFVYSNFSSSVSLEEFVITIVDRSDAANHWTELSNEYVLLAENVVANEVTESGVVRIPVEKTAANPEYGDYYLVIQGRISIDNIESVVLSFSDFSVVKDEEPAIYFVECPAMMKTIQADSTMNLAPRLKRSNVDFDGTQQWSSSDESVATVDENGVVTAVSEGTVTITVQETDVLKVIYTTEENGESVTYEIGSKHDFKTSFVMYVTPAPIVPDLVIPWNQYGEDVQGIGVDGMSDYWQEGDSKIITDALEAYQEGLSTTYSPTLKDIFMLHIAGTVSCSGQFDFGLADEREQVSYWEDMSVFQKGYKVVADESFDFTIALPISAVVQHTESGDVPLAEPHLMLAFLPENGSSLGIDKNIECYFDKYTMEFIPAGTVDVSLTQKEYSVDVAGESSVTLSLNLKTLSGNGEWKSLNEDVATVANGVVTGVAQGVAEIVYVEKYYGADFSDTCKITVLNSTRSPLPETETNISYCMGDKTVPLMAKTVDGGTLTWYDAAFAVLESAPTPSADDAGELVYYVSQKVDDFEESEKVKISVFVAPVPTVTVTSAAKASYVDYETEFTASSFLSGGTFYWSVNEENAGSVKTDGSSDTKKISFDVVGEQTVVAKFVMTESGCFSSDTLKFSVKDMPSIVFDQEEYEVELGSTLTLKPTYNNVLDLSQVTWTPDYSLFQIISSLDGSAELSAAYTTGEGIVSVKVNYYDVETNLTIYPEASCKVKIIESKVSPKPQIDKTEYVFCQNDNASPFAVYATGSGSLNWYDESENLLTAQPEISTKDAGFFKYYVSQTVGDKEESEKTLVTVKVAPIPTLNVTAPQAVYVNSSFTVSVVASEKGAFAWLHESYTDEGQTESSLPLTYAETGNKIVTVGFKDVYGCETSATATVKVKAMPSISFEKEEYEVLEGKTIVVTPVFANMPETVGSWSFEENTVLAEVTTGVSATYKGLSEGTGIVSCSVNYSDNETGYSDVLKASCKISVIPFTESLVCDVDEIEIYVGESAVINAVVHALGAETYSLVLSDSSKVEVTDRMLTALSAGELEVYAVCDGNSELRDTVKVTVKEFISAKELSLPKQVTIKEGSDTTLVASIIPSNATYTEVFFLEKEDEVVKVTADGKVVGKSAGTSVVTASTKEGLQAQTLVYVTSSEEEIVKIRLNEGSENVYLKVGESKTIACQVSPTTIKANDLVWASGNTEIAEVSPSGVLTAKKVGEMFLYISYKTVIDEKIKVFVTNSVAPTISYIPSVTMQQPGAAVTIDLANYVKDDATALENLQFSFAENENIATSISGTVVTLNLKNAEFIGKTSISVSAQDEEALVSSRDIEIDVVQKENEAPQILTETIYIPEGKYAQIVVADMAIDDYTPSDELTFEFEESDNLLARLVKNNTTLRVYAIEDEWSGDEILKVTFTDVDGLSTTKDIHVLAQEIENQAPVLLAIPTQHENDTVLFPTIDLSKYVTDDFTSSSEIQWTASTSENVSVVISGHYAEIADLNKYWRGAEVVTFTAMDQGGLTSSMDVTFYREVATSEVEKEFGWYGKPTVSIIASRYYGTPGDEFTLIGTFYGSDCSGKWEVDGLELEDPNALIQNLTFDTLGNYNVTFTVMYGEGDVINVGEVLGVVGIAERNPGICIGDIQVLTATEGMDSYLWSTGETSQSIQVNPNVTTDYTLQMTKGLTTFNDEVNLRVSVPVQLIQDSVMCEGTTYELVARGEYETYAWNTGAQTKSIEIPAAVADYKVTTTDDLGCESSAMFSVTKVNPLPTLNLGEDKTLCDKEKLTLDAGEGYVYDWNITKYDGSLVSSDNQSIVLDSSAYVTVQITDNNMCESFDTINVTFTYPYKEEIGVVTFSQSSKNIIIAWERTADVNTKNYQVERQLTNNEWETVGDPVLFGEFGIVVDEVANYEKKAYKYRLVTTDECGNQAVSGEYRSSFLQQTRTIDGKLALNWWTYQSPREGNVVASYLWRMPAEQPTSGDGEIEQNGFETVESFSATEDFVGFTDDENVFQKGDLVRVAFELDETVYENAIKDENGEVIEYQNKAESGPFSLAVSNIAEVESTSDVVDLFPADVAVYPTVVKNVIHVALASQAYNNYNVEVISADGQVVAHTQTGDVTKALVDIPAEGLTQGIYTVKISVGEMTKTIKVLK